MPKQLSLFDDQKPISEPAVPAQPLARVASVPYISPDPNVTLSAAIAAYIDYLAEAKMAEATRYAMTNDLNVLGSILGMSQPLNSLTKSSLDQLVVSLTDTSQPATVARRAHTLNSILDWLREQGALHSGLRLDVKHPEPIKITVLTHEQEQRLLAATSQEPRIAFLVQLVLGTGLKRNEIAPLERNKAAPLLHRHIQLDNDPPSIVIKSKIKYKDRLVAAPASLKPVYAAYCQSLGEESTTPDAPVFLVTARMLEHDLAKYAESLHIPCNFATLRWTAAVYFLRQGIDPERLCRKLGLSEDSWDETLERLKQLR